MGGAGHDAFRSTRSPRVDAAHPFGNLATRQTQQGVWAGPWLCVPALRRVCPFEDEEVFEPLRRNMLSRRLRASLTVYQQP